MNKVFLFGENVEGYRIPVLNEREIRATAWRILIAFFNFRVDSILEDETGSVFTKHTPSFARLFILL